MAWRTSQREEDTGEEAAAETRCRLCLVGEEDGPLVQPCACRGSAKWIHRHCLEEWRRTSPKEDAAYRCGQCVDEYRDALSLELLGARLQAERTEGEATCSTMSSCAATYNGVALNLSDTRIASALAFVATARSSKDMLLHSFDSLDDDATSTLGRLEPLMLPPFCSSLAFLSPPSFPSSPERFLSLFVVIPSVENKLVLAPEQKHNQPLLFRNKLSFISFVLLDRSEPATVPPNPVP